MRLNPDSIEIFRETVWRHYDDHARHMPWRADPTPYHVLVSELMLQQTQVSRVIPKFESFTYTYPNIASLAEAELSDVLRLWSGLGYNRRAKFLHQTARVIHSEHGDDVPRTMESLVKLPGIGPNTAGAIMTYAYEEPVVFIETNIRTVLFHHFYTQNAVVSDVELKKVAEQVLDHEQPRQWYWALMDYGTFLKKTAGGRLQQSKHYVKQSPLAGSVREMRGRILHSLVTSPKTLNALRRDVNADERFDVSYQALRDENLIEYEKNTVRLAR